MLRKCMLATAAALAVAAPAIAQDQQNHQPPVDCQATPAPQANERGDTTPSGGTDPGLTGSTFIDKLTPCDGVLRPPATGDQMTQPPPETGAMREIRPGELPDQQSNPQ